MGQHRLSANESISVLYDSMTIKLQGKNITELWVHIIHFGTERKRTNYKMYVLCCMQFKYKPKGAITE